ncbi:MAG: hypothetical protein ACI82A_004379 [Candidatus Azotimanducaceae bacterium]|jgi:hypothetical protein
MYEIPKIAVSIVLNLDNDESIPGTIWLTEDLVSAMGNPLVEEVLNNDDDMFISFQSEAGAFRIINKHHITYIQTEQTNEEAASQTPHEPHSMVVHFNNEQILYGLVYPTQAEETRVSDLLNQREQFQVLYRQDKKIIFNRACIVYANAN